MTDRSGRPIAGAIVQPVPAWAGMQWRLPSQALVEPQPFQEPRVSGDDGRFSLADLPPCPWQLVVRAPGCAPASVTLEAGSAYDVQVALDAGRSVTGTVWLPDGRPASGARVVLDPGGGLGCREERADERGVFLATELPRADLGVAVHARIGALDYVARGTLELGRGDRCRWDVTLEPGGALRGVLLLASGEPAAGLWVSARDARRRREDWVPNESPEPARWTCTDDAGRFAFTPLDAETLRVDVWEADEDGLRHLDSLDDVTVSARPLEHALRPACAVLTGAFLADGAAQLWLEHPSWPRARRVDVDPASGRFEVRDLCAGAYVLYAWRPGRSPQRVRTPRLAPGARVELAPITFDTEGEVVVAVFDGATHGGLDLALHDRTARGALRPRPLARVRLEAGEGRACLPGILAGDYVLLVGGDRRALERVPVHVESGRATEVALDLAPAVVGSLEVALSDGPETATVHLELFDERGDLRLRALRSVESHAALSFPLELPPGDYRAVARIPGTVRQAMADVRVEEGRAAGSFGRLSL